MTKPTTRGVHILKIVGLGFLVGIQNKRDDETRRRLAIRDPSAAFNRQTMHGEMRLSSARRLWTPGHRQCEWPYQLRLLRTHEQFGVLCEYSRFRFRSSGSEKGTDQPSINASPLFQSAVSAIRVRFRVGIHPRYEAVSTNSSLSWLQC